MAEKLTGEKLLATIKANVAHAFDVYADQLQRERDDIAFQLPENQWDPIAKEYRKGRPMVSVSLLAQPMQLVQNQAAQAHLGVEVHPVSEQADPDVAEVKQGLYRRIERDTDAQQARLWALDRAKKVGRGFYRVSTQWDEDGDSEWDQEIAIERILYQDSVYLDPSAEKADHEDIRWAFIARYITIEDFKALFPGKEAPSTTQEFKAWEGSDPKWVNADNAVLVVEYWWKETSYKDVKRPGDGLTRQKPNTTVRRAIVTARQIFEEEDWMGRYIPIIAVTGTELQPIDGARVWEGMIRPARDAQKIFNLGLSEQLAAAAKESKAPWVGPEGFMEGHEDEWERSNILDLPALQYKPTVGPNGELNPMPSRNPLDTSKSVIAQSLTATGRELAQMATNVYAPSLGEMPKERTSQSGRAILALQQQSDAGTSHYLQNLAAAMRYEARVILDLMPKVYDRPGRVVQVLGAEDEPRFVMLNKPFVQDQNGRPQPIPAGQVPPENVKVYDLKRGKYTVSVNIGKSFQTRLQEGDAAMSELIGNLPPQVQVLLLPTLLKFKDVPGAKEAYEILKKFRDKNFPGLDANEDGQPTVDQLKAQIEQMGQAGQVMQQQLQMAIKEIETEQAKQQAAIAKAQMDAQTKQLEIQSKAALAMADNDTKVRIAAADNETKLAIANLSKNMEAVLSLLNLESEQAQVAAANQQADADRQLQAAQGESEQGMERERMDREDERGQRQMAHERDMGGRQMMHEAAMAERQRSQMPGGATK